MMSEEVDTEREHFPHKLGCQEGEKDKARR